MRVIVEHEGGDDGRRRMWELTHVQRQALLDHRDHDPRRDVRERCAAMVKMADGQTAHAVVHQGQTLPSPSCPMGARLVPRSYASTARALAGARMCWNAHPPPVHDGMVLTGAYQQETSRAYRA